MESTEDLDVQIIQTRKRVRRKSESELEEELQGSEQVNKRPVKFHRKKVDGSSKELAAFPNHRYWKNVAISRKFMHFNYAFSSYSKKSHQVTKVERYPVSEWNEALERISSSQPYHRQLRYKSHMPDPSLQNPPPFWLYAGEFIKNGLCTDVDDFCEKFVRKTTSTFRDKLENLPKVECAPRQKVYTDVLDVLSSCCCDSENQKGDDVGLEMNTASVPGGSQQKELTLEWQVSNWVKPLIKESLSTDVNEIWYNRRLEGKTVSIQGLRQKFVPTTREVLLEALRSAYFKQNWLVAVKTLKGLISLGMIPGTVGGRGYKYWCLWNVAFCCLLRMDSDVYNIAENVKEIARHFLCFADTFNAKRIGIEIAIWLTQEGRFLDGLEFLEEMCTRENKERKGPTACDIKYFDDNLKFQSIHFLVELIKAAHLYAVYKAESLRNKVSELELQGMAYTALAAFESLLESCDKCDGEVTTFLDQLIELTIKCHSVTKAKEMLDQLIVSHYGNDFVENTRRIFMTTHFSERTFPSSSGADYTYEPTPRFQFDKLPSHYHHQGRSLLAYRRRREKEVEQRQHFTKLPNPAFSI